MRVWRILVRQRNMDLLDASLGEVRRLYARLRS
jgi:predicted alpha/beta hydrolase